MAQWSSADEKSATSDHRRSPRLPGATVLRFLVCVVAIASTQPAIAQRFFDGGTSQVWDSSTANWSLTTGGPYDQTWATGTAVFEGTGANVVVSGTVANISGIRFDAAGYTLSGGSLPFPNHNSPLTVNADATISASITGAGGIRKEGTGTLVLSGSNTYTGVTFLGVVSSTADAGVLSIGDVAALGTGTGNPGRINFVGNGRLRYTGSGAQAITTKDLFSDLANSSMTIDVSDATGSLTITPTGGTRARPFTKIGPGTLTMNGAFVNGTNGNAPITANGGTLILGANNSNTGATTISAGATLRVGAGSTTGALGSAAIANAGTLVVNRSNALTMAQAISGAGSLVKEGGGTLTLTGSNTYSGGTQIDGGTVIVNGSLGAGTVSLGSGTTLGGSGTIAGSLAGSGIVSPGNSPGVLTAASVDPSGGLDWEFEITGTLPDWAAATASINDVLRLTDATSPFAASLTGGNEVDFLFALPGTDPITAGSYTVGFFTDRASDFTADVASAAVEYWVLGEFGSPGDRQQFNVGTGGSAVWYTRLSAYDPALSASLSVVPVTADFGSGNVSGYSTSVIVVPEPGTLALAGPGLAVAAAMALRRRRRGA